LNDPLEEGRNKNLNDPRREELKRIVREKGLLWAIAAMVEGSIGYDTPNSAKIRIQQLMEDKYVHGCERSHACFEGDSISEIEHDFKYFQKIEETHPEKVTRLLHIIEKVSMWTHENQVGFGLMYPTMNI